VGSSSWARNSSCNSSVSPRRGSEEGEEVEAHKKIYDASRNKLSYR
jgi:hypothetical protein